MFHERPVVGSDVSIIVPESITIAGRRTKVKKWMTYTQAWMAEYLLNPFLEFQQSRFKAKGIEGRLTMEFGRTQPAPEWPDIFTWCNIL